MNAITILIIVNVFTALTMIVLTLMQQSKGDMGSAFGGGGSQSMFGSRGSSNFLSRTTSIMCTLFFLTSLALAYLYAQRDSTSSVVLPSSVIEQNSDMPSLDETSITPAIEGTDTNSVETESVIPEVDSMVDETTSSDLINAIPEVPAVNE